MYYCFYFLNFILFKFLKTKLSANTIIAIINDLIFIVIFNGSPYVNTKSNLQVLSWEPDRNWTVFTVLFFIK